MPIVQLIFSLNGRIRRRDWWLAMAGLLLCGSLVEFAGHQLLTGRSPQSFFDDRIGWMTLPSEPYDIFQWAVTALWAWPLLAVSVKRWHDRDRPGWLTVVIMLLNYAFIFLQGSSEVGSWLFYIALGVVSFALNVWQLIECGFLDGGGSNTYGPSPKGIAAAEDVF